MSDRITQIINDTGAAFGWSHESADILRSRIRAAHEKEVADLKARAGWLNERIADLEADKRELQERVERLEEAGRPSRYDCRLDDRGRVVAKIVNGDPKHRLSWVATYDDAGNQTSFIWAQDPENRLSWDHRPKIAADKEAEVTKIVPTGTEGAKLSEYGVAKLIAEHFGMKESPVQSKDGAFIRRNFKINIIDTERERYFELRVWSEGHE